CCSMAVPVGPVGAPRRAVLSTRGAYHLQPTDRAVLALLLPAGGQGAGGPARALPLPRSAPRPRHPDAASGRPDEGSERPSGAQQHRDHDGSLHPHGAKHGRRGGRTDPAGPAGQGSGGAPSGASEPIAPPIAPPETTKEHRSWSDAPVSRTNPGGRHWTRTSDLTDVNRAL